MEHLWDTVGMSDSHDQIDLGKPQVRRSPILISKMISWDRRSSMIFTINQTPEDALAAPIAASRES
jgi:hypothetical protein